MLRHRFFPRLVIFLAALSSATSFAADVLPKDEVDRFVKPILDGQYAKCIVVGLLTEHGRQIIGYGIKSDTDRTPPDGQSVFEIGSVTKTFTATLLAEAVLKGQMKLDDPVQKFLPDGVKIPKGKGDKPITLLHLTTHRSGLPRMPGNFAPGDPGNPYADYSVRQMYDYLSLLVLQHEPDERCEYSNLGVGLLGHALALQAKQGYEELLLEHICKPLKLGSTRVTLDESMKARIVPPYDVDGKLLKNWDLGTLVGAGGVRSTADDLLDYAAAQISLTKSEISPTIELTHQRQREFDKGHDIALGWIIMKGESFYLHNGQTGGYHTSVDFDPVKRVAVVVLSTTNSDLPDAIAIRLMRVLRGEKIEPPKPRMAIALDASALDHYVGVYKLGPLQWITIKKEGDRLTARVTGQSAVRIYPQSPTEFFWKSVDAQATFDLGADGVARAIVLHQNGKDVRAERTSEK